MSVIGLDLNATRARAVHGPASQVPVALRLEGEHFDFPVALSLEGRHAVAGRAGATLCRRLPHLACLDFLPYLGDARAWTAGRLRLDAGRALGLVFDALHRRLGKAEGLALALPPYLTEAQAALVARVAEKARWPLLGSVSAPVAAALAAHEQLPWSGLALVLDVDGHALSWSAVSLGEDRVELLQSQPSPRLARGAWMCRLLDGTANRCVRVSRRDPRDSADADQSLYDQLAEWLERGADEGPVELAAQAAQWYQLLTLSADDLRAFCAPLVQQTLAELQRFLLTSATPGPVGVVLMTAPAAQLPGLAAALRNHLQTPEEQQQLPDSDDDFGEDLLFGDHVSSHVHVLDADAVARAAHDLAVRLLRSELKRGHHDALSLPAPSLDSGAARLNFRGQDYPLAKTPFRLGRDPACDLVFESAQYPTVSARHCEIAFDRRAYVLRDRSRHGTLVNDTPVNGQAVLRAGDWIRLGPNGPALRFLGRPNRIADFGLRIAD
jgi:hypothetical protein